MFNDKSLSAPQFSHRSLIQLNREPSQARPKPSQAERAEKQSRTSGERAPSAPGSNDVFFGKLEAVSSSSITTSPHSKSFVQPHALTIMNMCICLIWRFTRVPTLGEKLIFGFLKLKWGRSIPEIEKKTLWHDRFVMADAKITNLNIGYTKLLV